MRSSFFLTAFLSAAFSYAVNRVGNGGDAVVCREKHDIRTAALLDLYESGLKPASWNGSREDIAQSVFRRLSLVSPEQAKMYERRWKAMPSELEVKDGIALVDVKDSEHVFVPTEKGCAIEQAAIRRKSPAENEKRFVADKTIWDKLDERSKAGLMLHEIVYEHLYKLGETDSVKARQLVSYLMSSEFEKASADQYWQRVSKLKLPIYR